MTIIYINEGVNLTFKKVDWKASWKMNLETQFFYDKLGFFRLKNLKKTQNWWNRSVESLHITAHIVYGDWKCFTRSFFYFYKSLWLTERRAVFYFATNHMRETLWDSKKKQMWRGLKEFICKTHSQRNRGTDLKSFWAI